MPLTRLTIIACDPTRNSFEWNDEPRDGRRMVFLDGAACMQLSLRAALAEPMLDTERVVLDCVASAETVLEMLASLPQQFTGDMLRIDKRGAGFLSATGRGGLRVLYALDPDDVHFYLATNGLLRGADAVLLEKTA